jgi:glycosyltransferase involved in cell wall biosynthesis
MFKAAKKHIIIAKLFEFGGSNSHLKALIKYLGKENIILLLENEDQLLYLKNIGDTTDIIIKIMPQLHHYAHLSNNFTTNIKELFQILKSVFAIQLLSFKYSYASVTICSVEPEKYLYLLWLPWVKVYYILHSTPNKKHTHFTSYTCNTNLSKRKRIITVSQSNKQLICENWDIAYNKEKFVNVIYNCLLKDKLNHVKTQTTKSNNQQHIVTMGHVIDYKNPYVWLDVAKLVTSKYSNVIFIWLGDGPLLKEFKDATKMLDNIRFEGYKADTDMYLKGACIYYQPSLQETHGIAVVEAMANQLPCVSSNAGGLPESVQHQFNGLLLSATDTQGQANAILTLLNNPDLSRQYGLNGYLKYNELFSYKSFKLNMDALYSS